MKLSIVIPAYNEEATLDTLYHRLCAILNHASYSYEILLVNDGSTDNTWQHISALCAADARVKGVNLSRNFGHQYALTAGLDIAEGERIFILDADLQDPPELLPEMMKKMDSGYDVVYGKRTQREGETWFKTKSARYFYRIFNTLSDHPIPEDTGDFRLISRRALNAVKSMPESVRFIRGMVSWVGFPQTALPYERAARSAGESHYPLSKMVRFALDALTSFSTRPLKLAIYIGFFMVCISASVLIYALISWFFADTARGWTSLLAIFAIFSGLQWVFIGILGDYIGRIYTESKRRPAYFIQDIIQKPQE